VSVVGSAIGGFFLLGARNTRLLPGSAGEVRFSILSVNRRGARSTFGVERGIASTGRQTPGCRVRSGLGRTVASARPATPPLQ
jgi:hypothetical protein